MNHSTVNKIVTHLYLIFFTLALDDNNNACNDTERNDTGYKEHIQTKSNRNEIDQEYKDNRYTYQKCIKKHFRKAILTLNACLNKTILQHASPHTKDILA